jgi:hypothetical protein
VSSRARIVLQTTAVCAVALCAGLARANHSEPGKGRSVKMPLVTAYAPCTAPNTATAGANPVPACTPPVRNDPYCSFDLPDLQNGSGKASAVSLSNGDIQLKLSARGLGLGCEGHTLCGAISIRATTDRCQAGTACTVIDLINYAATPPTGCCVVTSGTCKLKTSINAIRFDTVRPGDRAGVELFGCGLRRTTLAEGESTLPTDLSFRCGPLAGPLSPGP